MNHDTMELHFFPYSTFWDVGSRAPYTSSWCQDNVAYGWPIQGLLLIYTYVTHTPNISVCNYQPVHLLYKSLTLEYSTSMLDSSVLPSKSA